MKCFGWTAAAGLIFSVLEASSAHAQQLRTWVSGTGDDASATCSRTAPCKTFSGAFTKTNAGGEINCLDGGAFGGFNINKAITISCEGVTAGSNSFSIAAGPSDVVHLIGLDINGFGNSFYGVLFNSGAALIVQDCKIRGSNADGGLGVQFQPSTAATLTIKNTSITNSGSASSGGGILISATGSGSTKATLHNVDIASNTYGMGIVSSGQQVIVEIINSRITNNKAVGVVVSGAGVTATLSRSAITNNGGASSSGPLYSYLDNSIIGNASNTPLTTVGGYQ